MDSRSGLDLAMILGLVALVVVFFLVAPLPGLGGLVDTMLAAVAGLFALFLTVVGLSRVRTGEWLAYWRDVVGLIPKGDRL